MTADYTPSADWRWLSDALAEHQLDALEPMCTCGEWLQGDDGSTDLQAAHLADVLRPLIEEHLASAAQEAPLRAAVPKRGRCEECGHGAHVLQCLNAASDNGCSCRGVMDDADVTEARDAVDAMFGTDPRHWLLAAVAVNSTRPMRAVLDQTEEVR